MKKIGTYTARGVVTEEQTEAGLPEKITLFDGLFTTAYRVTGFKIWSSGTGNNTSPDCVGKLSKNELGVTGAANFFRADDDNQIAWAVSGSGSDGSNAGEFSESIIDLDNMIVEDLFVYVRAATDGTTINYLVTMEKYQISDWKGALTMARDKAQE